MCIRDRGNAVPTFTLSSADTPSPIIYGGKVDTSVMEVSKDAVSYTHLDVYKRQLVHLVRKSVTVQVNECRKSLACVA